MTEEIKEILDYIDERIIPNEKWNKIKDYITKLQQDLDKANDIIEKDRQFYKCRMDEYVELKKENERLKEDNLLIKSANKLVSDNLHNYKSRCEKANDFIDNYDVFKEFSFPLMKRDIENQIKSSIDYEFNSTFRKKLKNILNESDEK